ncbi:alpha/beta hydrolase [Streptomyces sp. 147326]|uniref:alpha/beta hydrolase n=1 Tax=Streptomyces sp. 147326 TaxID=3074379 RepID=UPI0038579994
MGGGLVRQAGRARPTAAPQRRRPPGAGLRARRRHRGGDPAGGRDRARGPYDAQRRHWPRHLHPADRRPGAPTEQTAERLGSGVVLAYEGEGHTGYLFSSCVRGYVHHFLLDGQLPAGNRTCPDEG